MALELVKYPHMIRVAVLFYKSIGEDLFEHLNTNRYTYTLYRLLFVLGFVNFNLLVIGELVHFGLSLRSRDTVLSAIAVAPCIGFSLLADFKQIALMVHRQSMLSHFGIMQSLFPHTSAAQLSYRLQQHLRIMKRVMFGFVVVCFSYTTLFSVYPIMKSTVRYWLLGATEFERGFGFLIWYPFNTTADNLTYGLVYVSQMWAGHVAGAAFVAADLLLVSSITQLSMHFQYICKQLETYVPDERHVGGAEADVRYLQQLIQYHAKCLEQSENMNKIFGMSLLMNFMVASLTICFIGFQVTTSTTEDICKYFIFLLASLVQVFLVCYYGDALISSSIRVGDAAYQQLWFNAHQRYKYMLVYIIQRSQQPASIRPPTFPPISFNTYMKVISMSYQFFTLLRTTYFED